MKKFLNNHRKIVLIVGVYLGGSFLLAVCSYLYFYFRSTSLVAIFLLTFVISYFMPLLFKILLGAKVYNGEYKNRLIKFSKLNDVSIKEIYVRKSNKSNACAISYGNSRSVVFNLNTLDKHPYDEIEAVMAHELGHHSSGDIYLYTSIIASTISLSSWFNVVTNITLEKNLGNLVLGSFIIAAVLLPIILLISRWREGLADSYAKKILKDPSALARFFERSIDFEKREGNVVPRDPNFIYRSFQMHPWIYDRIQFFKN